jgi:ferric-dicitrate binding protein FerR (iron transport regulator)
MSTQHDNEGNVERNVEPNSLDPWFAAAREHLSQIEPPPWLEHQLHERAAERSALAEVRRARPHLTPASRSAPRLRRWWPALAGAAAAGLALAIAIPLWIAGPMPAPANSAPAASAEPPFIALAALDTIEAESGTRIVPARLPRTALADFGLPIDPGRADVPVKADLLMSPRGVVLAVRFVE